LRSTERGACAQLGIGSPYFRLGYRTNASPGCHTRQAAFALLVPGKGRIANNRLSLAPHWSRCAQGRRSQLPSPHALFFTHGRHT
jgi:hypothetical protein